MRKRVRFIAYVGHEDGIVSEVPFLATCFNESIDTIKKELCGYLGVDENIDMEELKTILGWTLMNSILKASSEQHLMLNTLVQKCVFIFQYYYHIHGIEYCAKRKQLEFTEPVVIEGGFIVNEMG